MATPAPIDFRRVREFGDVLNVSFTFFRQHFKHLSLTLLVLVAPLMAIIGVLMMIMVGDYLNLIESVTANPDSLDAMQGAGVMMVSFLGLMLFQLLYFSQNTAVVMAYIKLYQKEGPENYTIGDVFRASRKLFWPYMGMLILLSIFLSIVYVAALIPLSIVASIGAISNNFIIIGLFIAGGILAILALIAYFTTVMSMAFPMRMAEKVGVFDAFVRSFRLVKGNWWATFGALFIATVAYFILTLLFNIPGYILSFSMNMHMLGGEEASMSFLFIVLTVIGSIGSIIFYTIPLTAMATQYYSLVEQKESRGLRDRIASLAVDPYAADPYPDGEMPRSKPERPASDYAPPSMPPPKQEGDDA